MALGFRLAWRLVAAFLAAVLTMGVGDVTVHHFRHHHHSHTTSAKPIG